jgi:hypothetical protein
MARTIKQKYRGSKAFDRSCRNHGSCSYCENNRLHKHNKKIGAYKTNTIED